jgi:hypothetical protein
MIRLRDPRLTRDNCSAMLETRRRQLDTRACREKTRENPRWWGDRPSVDGGGSGRESQSGAVPIVGDRPRSSALVDTRDARCVSALRVPDVMSVASFRHSADGKINAT